MVKSVSLRFHSLSVVDFVNARTVLRRFLVISKSRKSALVGLSVVPAVSDPSHRIMLPRERADMLICSQRSSRLLIRFCILGRFGATRHFGDVCR